MTRSSQQARRLVIAASSFADAEAALPLIVPLLDLMPARLAGLLAGERIADLAVTAKQQIVSSRGALLSIPSQERAHGLSQGDARAFERALASAAASHATSWRFATETGELTGTVCASVTKEDVVVLGHRPILRQRGRVLLIGTGTDARDVAQALARAQSTVVDEMQPAEGEATQDILAKVDRSHAATVVADFSAGPLRTREELKRLLEAARCPVAILGAAEIRHRQDAASDQNTP
ncbi:MAG: hypothetical protein JXR14_07095 [Paracoccaceae bacterium]